MNHGLRRLKDYAELRTMLSHGENASAQAAKSIFDFLSRIARISEQ
jgi:hypothetical protein